MLNFLLRMQLDLKFKKESGLSSHKDKITKNIAMKYLKNKYHLLKEYLKKVLFVNNVV